VIVWLNGTFGVGKTTVARELIGLLPGTRLFDTEWVGYMLAENFRDHEITDFQQLPPWRSLVPLVLAEVTRFTGQHLVVAQSVLDVDYWTELRDGLDRCSLELLHVVLHADEAVLTARIDGDTVESGARQWRLDHRSSYTAARRWLDESADLVVDTTVLPAPDVATRIAAAPGSPPPVTSAGPSAHRRSTC